MITTDRDPSLPFGAATVRQAAVVFTALGGPCEGQLVYQIGGLEWLRAHAVWLNAQAEKRGKTADARVMVRTVTVGEWEDL